MTDEDHEPEPKPDDEHGRAEAKEPTLGEVYRRALGDPGGGTLVGRLNSQIVNGPGPGPVLGRLNAVSAAHGSLSGVLNATAGVAGLGRPWFDQLDGFSSESARSLIAQAALAMPQGAIAKAAVDAMQAIGNPGASLILQAQRSMPLSMINQAALDAVQGFGYPGGSLVAQAMAQLASPGIQGLLTSKLPSIIGLAQTGMLARAARLEAEFATPYPGRSAGFAALQDRIDTSPRLAAEVAGFAQAAAAPPKGAMKLPAKELHERAARIEDALTDEPELREELAIPLAEVQAVSATDDWDTVNVASLLGFGNWVRRVDGIAVACGVSISVARFLVGAGTGQPPEMAAWEAVTSGAAVYVFVNGRRYGREQ